MDCQGTPSPQETDAVPPHIPDSAHIIISSDIFLPNHGSNISLVLHQSVSWPILLNDLKYVALLGLVSHRVVLRHGRQGDPLLRQPMQCHLSFVYVIILHATYLLNLIVVIGLFNLQIANILLSFTPF
ncbi:hypothetical protein KFK09_023228 [Dendrobium nobile]|uniref:Uncharacterized protein n=1 Tax=Dendrobium nobile TaxID=94219 RepID=A0A8T3AM61_DENNO|nr:hypothetical protein KFK09_023228 [Dendrobium nobile]